MSSFKSLCFFITSFFPLWIAILIEEIKSICENDNYVVTEWIMIVCILLSFGISFLTVVFSFKNAKKKKRTNARYTLAKITKQKSITAEYVLAYIVPLIAFDFTHWDGVLIFGILFSILTFLCLKHSYFSVNPITLPQAVLFISKIQQIIFSCCVHTITCSNIQDLIFKNL